jgi:hypothetical protein
VFAKLGNCQLNHLWRHLSVRARETWQGIQGPFSIVLGSKFRFFENEFILPKMDD